MRHLVYFIDGVLFFVRLFVCFFISGFVILNFRIITTNLIFITVNHDLAHCQTIMTIETCKPALLWLDSEKKMKSDQSTPT